GALTEAVGIGLFVPLLDSVSNKPNFGNIPILSQVSEAFSHIPPELRIKIVAFLLLVVVAARSGLQLLIQYLQVYLPAKVDQRLRDTAFDYLLRMDLTVVNKSKSGSAQNFVGTYPSRISLIIGSLGTLISNFALLIIYTSLMMLISITLTMMSLLFM